MDNNPRKPTSEEYQSLAKAMNLQSFGHEEDSEESDTLLYISGLCIAIFDNYVTDCPGWCGKIAIIVYGGDPSFYHLYRYVNGPTKQNPNPNYHWEYQLKDGEH